jgi:hypothetical protein
MRTAEITYVVIDTEKLTEKSNFYGIDETGNVGFTQDWKKAALYVEHPHGNHSYVITLEQLLDFLLKEACDQVHSVYEGGKY